MVVERKKVKYNESVFYVEHWPSLTHTECGKLNQLISCPFYEVMFRDGIYKFWKSVNNKQELTVHNLERHRCMLLNHVFGVESGDKLWELCPGEKVEG